MYVSFPMYPSDVAHSAGSGNGLTYPNTPSLFRWFRLGYIGARGSMRYRVQDLNTSLDEIGTVCLPACFSIGPTCNNGTGSSGGATTTPFGWMSFSGIGRSIADGRLLHEADFSVPDYNYERFHPMMSATQDVTFSEYRNFVSLRVSKVAKDMTKCVFNVGVATGDDFSFFGWQGPLNVKVV